MKEFIKQCKKNRLALDYTYDDVSDSLIGVSEKEYIEFEEGRGTLSEENLDRLCRILCLKSPKKFNLDDYIDTDGLNEEELDDLKKVVEVIVGDLDD